MDLRILGFFQKNVIDIWPIHDFPPNIFFIVKIKKKPISPKKYLGHLDTMSNFKFLNQILADMKCKDLSK